jgi:NADPH-dependent 2,4-dienoyl-CoA reductase/sulfur reductase-like enzyme
MAEFPGTKIVRRQGNGPVRKVEGDICVVGAGAAGASAAIEAARLGRKVILVDGMPAFGGQAVNSIIGTFCGLFPTARTATSSPTASPTTSWRRSARTASSSITAMAR